VTQLGDRHARLPWFNDTVVPPRLWASIAVAPHLALAIRFVPLTLVFGSTRVRNPTAVNGTSLTGGPFVRRAVHSSIGPEIERRRLRSEGCGEPSYKRKGQS
jgi:hypothetical protein